MNNPLEKLKNLIEKIEYYGRDTIIAVYIHHDDFPYLIEGIIKECPYEVPRGMYNFELWGIKIIRSGHIPGGCLIPVTNTDIETITRRIR